jgi:hypothetical protein
MTRFEERLDCAPFSAVIARVTYQTIVLDFRHNPGRYVEPVDGIHELRRDMSARGFESIACWLVAFAFAISDRGFSSKQARDWVVDRAMKAEANRRRGTPWRRVPDSCPRVTNRGATLRSSSRAVSSGDEVPQ